jgi:phospholipid/cholesterol/gamma-HCH transport system substrate-binding protein
MPSARRVSWARFRVTVVATVAIIILLTLVYLLSGSTLFRQQADLVIYVPDATGIVPGASVELSGIPIGTVDAVQLTGSNQPDRIVRLKLTILRERLITIPQDSIAQIDSEGVLGDKLISITSGTSPTSIRSGSELNFKAQADLMRSLDLTQFEKELRNVDVMLTDIENGTSPVGQFILGDEMYNSLSRRVSQIGEAVHAAADTAGDLGESLYTDRLYQKIREPIVKMDQSLAQLQSGQGSSGQFLRDPAQYESLRNDIAQLRKSIADVRSNSFIASDEAYAGWNHTLADWIRNVERINADPLFNTSEMYDNLAGAANEMRDSVKDFRQNPQKFLRLRVF